MKPMRISLSVVGVALLILAATYKPATAEPKPQKHQAVVLHTQEHYEYQRLSVQETTSRYAGMRVYNSSSSPGAPVFTNLAYYYTSEYRTNEFGQVQQGYYEETTKPIQIADAIAQLLDDGFRIVNVETPSDQFGSGPTRYVFVK